MNKIKATRKDMKENYYIISVSYCGLQTLLKHQEPIAYSTRAEGWACDYYDINGVIISTGYSPINSKRTKASYELIRKYENKARIINDNYKLSYEVRKNKINKLLSEFIELSKNL